MAGIGKLRAVVLDCPDPAGLAGFYAALVGGEVAVSDDGEWATLRDGADVRLSFQRADDYRPPTWPDPETPQQFHVDVTVDEVDTAEKQVLALGASKTKLQPGEDEGENWRVYVDPVGHPFCLIWD